MKTVKGCTIYPLPANQYENYHPAWQLFQKAIQRYNCIGASAMCNSDIALEFVEALFPDPSRQVQSYPERLKLLERCALL